MMTFYMTVGNHFAAHTLGAMKNAIKEVNHRLKEKRGFIPLQFIYPRKCRSFTLRILSTSVAVNCIHCQHCHARSGWHRFGRVWNRDGLPGNYDAHCWWEYPRGNVHRHEEFVNNDHRQDFVRRWMRHSGHCALMITVSRLASTFISRCNEPLFYPALSSAWHMPFLILPACSSRRSWRKLPLFLSPTMQDGMVMLFGQVY